MKACIIFNPAARGDKARHFQKHLDSFTAHFTLKPTQQAGDARRLATVAIAEGFDLLVAAGGDGTVNEVLNGIADAPEGLAKTRLAVFPLGTANVFAKEIAMPARFRQALPILEQARETTIDLAEVQFGPHHQLQRRLFVQMAGAGVDSRAIELVDWEDKKRFGKLAYVAAACKALHETKPTITASTGTLTLAGEQILIGNGRYYGGRYPVFPLANNRDGLLEITLFPRASWPAVFRGAWGLLTNRLYSQGGLHHLRTPSFTLTSPLQTPFHVEGENIGHLPAQFSIHPQPLRVIVP